jgi:hypothetical protein
MESHPEIGICGSSVEAFNDQTKQSRTIDFATNDTEIKAFTFFQSPFNQPSIMIRKSVLDQHDLNYPSAYYPDADYWAEDYALWIEILQYTQGANLPVILTRYRKHDLSVTTVADKKTDGRLKSVLHIQERYLHYTGVTFSPEQMDTYTRFTDRSFFYSLNSKNQQAVDKLLKSFFSQLSKNKEILLPEVMHQLSIICFYKFVIDRKIPRTLLLQKLFVKGGWFYFKKMFIKPTSYA